jgi:hypothetical protein
VLGLGDDQRTDRQHVSERLEGRMKITKQELLAQLREAWQNGHQAGYEYGEQVSEWDRDVSLGYSHGGEPVPATNPY